MADGYMQDVKGASARAIGRNLPISSKQCIELCSFLRGKRLDRAIATLDRVCAKEQAVPFKRFANGVGHKPGPMAAGRYPIKAAAAMRDLFKGVKANANAKGLSGELIIAHLAANRAARPMRNRLKHRGSFKRTHVEIIVTEHHVQKNPTPKASAKKAARKAAVAEAAS